MKPVSKQTQVFTRVQMRMRRMNVAGPYRATRDADAYLRSECEGASM